MLPWLLPWAPLLACAGAPQETAFLRDAVLLPPGFAAGGRHLPAGTLVRVDWSPGEEIELGGTRLQAPDRASCVPLFHVPLGDVSRLAAMGGTAPDTALAFSPGGERLAIGAYTGELLVVDGWTGREAARRRLAETQVKQVAWSPDGGTLYAAEQSPDAWVQALDPDTLEARWRYRLADQVGSSAPPPGEDLYGVYTLPAAYGLEVLENGDLLVTAVHGWNDATGTRRNASRLLRISPRGELVAAWPQAGPADAAFRAARVDLEGGLVALPIDRSADGPAPAGLPVGGIQVLELDDLSPVLSRRPRPLAPWFREVFYWEGVDLDREQDALLAGLGDGRVLVWPLSGGAPSRVDAGTPILAGGVPVAASVGHAALWRDGFLAVTAASSIPYAAAAPDLRPPAPHPAENALWYFGLDGTLRWTWRGPQVLQGLTLAPDGHTVVVGAGPRRSDDRRDLFGALVFELDGRGSGEQRLLASCSTAAPVFFRQAAAPGGRVAVAEHPWLQPDGSVEGGYRVTVLR